MPFKPEPIFDHRPPSDWYVEFAAKHDIKIVVYPTYNPDFWIEDGTWIEATLSENTAYKKVFKHGHQFQKLIVLWLDKDTGRHSDICRDVVFPNASVIQAGTFFSSLAGSVEGEKLLEQFNQLERLKGIVY